MIRKKWFRSILVGFALLLVAVPAFAASSFSAWGPAASLESIPGTSAELNTPALEGCPILSRDGLQLYIASNRPGGLGGIDIWVAERASPEEPFGAPANLGAPINSPDNDFCPSPLRDGQGFMFVSNRPGGCGGADIYMTRYHPEQGWGAPENLGCQVNSSADEAGPVLVYAEPGPPTLFFSSARVGGQGSFDIWSASRDSIAAPWSTPVNLGLNMNSAASESRPSLSWDGTMLLFGTTRPGVEGASDIFYTTRD